MSRNLPPKIKSKIDTLKNVILATGGFTSEFGNDVSLNLVQIDYDYTNDESFKVYEIVLSINFKNVYCDDCDFETEKLSDMLFEMREKVRNACNKFWLTEDLQFKKGATSCRGVLNWEFKYATDNFDQLSFGIFLDPGSSY